MINKSHQIWLDVIQMNQYAEIMHAFSLESKPDSAVLQIYCETEYVLNINGSFVGSGQFKSFDNKRVYDTYSVADMLKAGDNEIFITATHQHTDTQTYAAGVAGVAFSLEADGNICALSGEESRIRPCTLYRNGEIEMGSPQLGYVYHYDAAKKPVRWQTPHIMKCDAPFVPRPVGKLIHLPVECGKICTQGVLRRENAPTGITAEAMQRDYLSYRDREEIFQGGSILKNDDGVYFIIDLGNEYAGLFTMTLTASEGTEIDIGYGEQLDDLRVRTYVGERCFAVSYVCCDGEQSFTGYFRRFAGRYISVHIVNMTGDVSFDEIGIIPTCYPIAKKEYFKCNDYFYNRLFDVSVNTLKLCMHEHYEDCPWREQALYAFDSFVQMRCGYYAYGEYEFAKASLELMADGQWENGLLELSSPGKRTFTIPSFALCWVMSLQHYVLYSGDMEFGIKMLPVAEKILNHFTVEDGIVVKEESEANWYFYEWSDGGTDGYGEYRYTKTDALINFYYIMACQSYNELLEYAGRKPSYSLDKMRQSCHEMFFDSKRKVYRTFTDKEQCHELTQALAILSGVADSKSLAPVLANAENELVKITLSASIYKYDALLKDGNKYLEFVIDDIANIWGKMIFAGANTLWESFGGADEFSLAGSLCHAWSAVPVYVLYRYLIGLNPTKPGFEAYELNPGAADSLNKAEAKLYMPKETLNVRISDGKLTV